MPDHKFDRQIDRRIVLLDDKQRIIDMMESFDSFPEVGIYDEPVRYFKANKEWCKFIFGWLDWLEDVAGWREAEDDNHPAIQAILIFEEGIDMTLSDDISNGIYKAFNDLAKQIVSGRTTNISVGEDGTVSNPSDSADIDLPDDDPDTPDFDERAAAHSGASLAVALGVNEFLAYLDTLYGVDATADNSLATAQYLVNSIYQTNDTLMNAALAVYWSERGAGEPEITSLDREDLAQELYCSAYGDVWDSVVRFIVELPFPTVAQKQTCTALINALEENQWSIWQSTGSAAPSTEYLNYACVPSPDENVNVLSVGTSYISLTGWKINHRLRLTVTGFLTDAAGNKRDLLYHKTAAGVVTSAIAALQLFVGLAVTKPTTSQCPYNLTGSYVFTLDAPMTSALSITLNSSGAWTTPATGTISVLIEDLGQVL